jgi:hypothetical protein
LRSDYLTLAEFCEKYLVRKTTLFNEMRAGRLHTVKYGPRRTLIPVTEAERWAKARIVPQEVAR